MYILCRDRDKFVQLLLKKFFLCEWLLPETFQVFKERAAASERYQCAAASERKCAADISLYALLLLETFYVFKGICGCFWNDINHCF